jgi:uncharacterized SAM-binding protein YcdF (DUF218 family)
MVGLVGRPGADAGHRRPAIFFFVSKITGFFALPSNALIIVALVGVLLLRTRFARAGWWVTMCGVVALAIIGLSPVGNVLIIPLEDRFPPWDASRGVPDGIIVLGGAVTPDISAAHHDPALNEAAERITAVVELARRYPNARIVFSGGDGNLIPIGSEADAALLAFERLGLPRERVLTEGKSRNTVENAVFSKRLVAPKAGERWLLVTSAYHMPRAIGVFRQAGFPVEAYPVDWRTVGPEDALRPFGSFSEGIRRTDTAVREWIGLTVYWLTGRSSALFPAP